METIELSDYGAQTAFADEATALAKKSQNPVASLISVAFENNFNFGVGPEDNFQYVLNAKPVVPQELTENWNLIHRVIQPLVAQDNLTKDTGALTDESQFGLADVTYEAFFTPANTGKLIWGFGPQVTVPWGDDAYTSDKWNAGFASVFLTMPGRWVIGSLITQEWDFAGKGSAEDVSRGVIQPFVNYNFDKGWFLTFAPVWTVNWEAERDSDRWTIPLGGGGGRIFSIGEQKVRLQATGFGYVASPDFIDNDWTLQIDFRLLFPAG